MNNVKYYLHQNNKRVTITTAAQNEASAAYTVLLNFDIHLCYNTHGDFVINFKWNGFDFTLVHFGKGVFNEDMAGHTRTRFIYSLNRKTQFLQLSYVLLMF